MPIELVATIVSALVSAIVFLFFMVVKTLRGQISELKRQIKEDKAFIKRQELALDILIAETKKVIDIGKTVVDVGLRQREDSGKVAEILERVDKVLSRKEEQDRC
jgi:hypothetical protein